MAPCTRHSSVSSSAPNSPSGYSIVDCSSGSAVGSSGPADGAGSAEPLASGCFPGSDPDGSPPVFFPWMRRRSILALFGFTPEYSLSLPAFRLSPTSGSRARPRPDRSESDLPLSLLERCDDPERDARLGSEGDPSRPIGASGGCGSSGTSQPSS